MIEANINASALALSHCIKRFYLTVFEGYKEKFLYNDVEYGSAFHVFRQVLATTKDFDKAVFEAQKYYATKSRDPFFIVKKKKEWLNIGHLTLTCKQYLDEFGLKDSFGDFKRIQVEDQVLVEQNFKIEGYIQTSLGKYNLCGTIDELGSFDQGCYGIGDDKTTSSWDQEKYLEAYNHHVQLPFYLLAIHEIAKRYPTSIFGEMIKKRIGCFINGVFLSERAPTVFKRSRIFFFDQKRLEEIRKQIVNLVNRIELCDPLTREGMINNTCESKYNTVCPFLPGCSAPDEYAEQSLLGNSFKKQEYNPLNFRKLC